MRDIDDKDLEAVDGAGDDQDVGSSGPYFSAKRNRGNPPVEEQPPGGYNPPNFVGRDDDDVDGGGSGGSSNMGPG